MKILYTGRATHSNVMDWRILQECFVAVVVLYLLKVLFFSRSSKKINLPPGPPSLPIIGSLHHLAGDSPHRSLAKLSQKYGPLMSVRFGQKLCVVATSPQTAMEFLKNQDANFNRRPTFRATKLIWPEGRSPLANICSSFHLHKLVLLIVTLTHVDSCSKCTH